MKSSMFSLLMFLALPSWCHSQDDLQTQLIELLKENRTLRARIVELEKKVEDLTTKLAQYQNEETILGFTFEGPTDNQYLPPGQYFTCRGVYSPNSTQISETHIWLFLMDESLDGYYLQGPVELKKDGKWEGRIRPGTAIVRLVAIQADKNAHKVFLNWLANQEIGKKYDLPSGAKVVSKRKIRT